MTESPYFIQLGGRATIEKVHKIFYDKVYAHPWLKQFFAASPREHQESQQNDFMVSIMGGDPAAYSGRIPRDAHPHLFITDEIFDIRHRLLADAMAEAGVPDGLASLWLRRDEGFRKVLVKKSIDECHGRYKTEPIIAPPKP